MEKLIVKISDIYFWIYLERNILEDDDRVLSRVLFEECLEVGRAGGQDHLVSLARLSIASQRDVCKGLLVAEVLEGGDHVGLEVIPTKAKLLLVTLSHF